MAAEKRAQIGDSGGVIPKDREVIPPDGLFDPRRIEELTRVRALDYLETLSKDSDEYVELVFKAHAMWPGPDFANNPSSYGVLSTTYSEVTNLEIDVKRLAHTKILLPEDFNSVFGTRMEELVNIKTVIVGLNSPENILEKRTLTPDDRISPIHFIGQVITGRYSPDEKRFIAAVSRDILPDLSELFPIKPEDHLRLDAEMARHLEAERYADFIRTAFMRTAWSNSIKFNVKFGMKFNLPEELPAADQAISEDSQPVAPHRIKLFDRLTRRTKKGNGEPSRSAS